MWDEHDDINRKIRQFEPSNTEEEQIEIEKLENRVAAIRDVVINEKYDKKKILSDKLADFEDEQEYNLQKLYSITQDAKNTRENLAIRLRLQRVMLSSIIVLVIFAVIVTK